MNNNKPATAPAAVPQATPIVQPVPKTQTQPAQVEPVVAEPAPKI